VKGSFSGLLILSKREALKAEHFNPLFGGSPFHWRFWRRFQFVFLRASGFLTDESWRLWTSAQLYKPMVRFIWFDLPRDEFCSLENWRIQQFWGWSLYYTEDIKTSKEISLCLLLPKYHRLSTLWSSSHSCIILVALLPLRIFTGSMKCELWICSHSVFSSQWQQRPIKAVHVNPISCLCSTASRWKSTLVTIFLSEH